MTEADGGQQKPRIRRAFGEADERSNPRPSAWQAVQRTARRGTIMNACNHGRFRGSRPPESAWLYGPLLDRSEHESPSARSASVLSPQSRSEDSRPSARREPRVRRALAAPARSAPDVLVKLVERPGRTRETEATLGVVRKPGVRVRGDGHRTPRVSRKFFKPLEEGHRGRNALGAPCTCRPGGRPGSR
jgi:hypothetical protein